MTTKEMIEGKLIPFDFSDDLAGEVIVYKNTGHKFVIIKQIHDMVIYCDGVITYECLLRYYEFVDGTPCGKYES